MIYHDTIFLQDCREGMQSLPDDSVDLIFTDPPYVKDQWEEAFQILADETPRILKPGSLLVTYSPHLRLPDIFRMFHGRLEWFWEVCQLNGVSTIVWSRNAIASHKPILMFYKPPLTPPPRGFSDVIGGKRSKRYHEWEQDVSEALYFMGRLCNPGDLVLDPFAGSGTSLLAAKLLGYRYLGFEIDPVAYETALERLQQQPITGWFGEATS